MADRKFRLESLTTWERVAPGWLRERDFIAESARDVTDALVDRLDPRAGDTVLEIAAGAGDCGLAVARRLGPKGRLISTDISLTMVMAATERAAGVGVGNVDLRVADAEHLDLETDTVDGVICRWGYMFMEHPRVALAETRRVLRPGRRVAFATWGDPAANAWAEVPERVMAEHGHIEPASPGDPGIFAMSSTDLVAEMTRGGGFEHVEITEMTVPWQFSDFDFYWRFMSGMAFAISGPVGALAPRDRERVRADVEREIGEHVRPGPGFVLEGLCLNVLAW